MPEASEVKLTVDYLASVLDNRAIVDIQFVAGKYTTTSPEGFDEIQEALPLMVESVNCKGKFIYFILYNETKNFYILHSLMMTGRWQIYEDAQCKWYFELDDGTLMWFRDPRCFATIKFTSDVEVLNAKLAELGPDILSEEFTLPVWKKICASHKGKNITSFVMDQSIISGCGNYIKAESLYYASIAPTRKVGELSEQEIEKLFEALRVIPRISYNYGGLSLKDYANEEGEKGKYETELKIYGKKTAKRLKTCDGRITYWDPIKQK